MLGQTVLQQAFPHTSVVINDNSQVVAQVADTSGKTKMLFVFASPKGINDKLRSVEGGLTQLKNDYGVGPFSIYGQPYLNAYAAAETNAATLQCMRIAATNAVYANTHIVAKYKVVAATVDPVAPAKMVVKFVAKTTASLTDISKLSDPVTVATEADTDGFSEVHLLSFARNGKGSEGNNLKMRLSNHARGDKTTKFKNYLLEVIDDTLVVEDFRVAFTENAVVGENNYFADGVIGDLATGSQQILFRTNLEGFATLFNAYKTSVVTDTALNVDTFDPLLGIDKNTGLAITQFELTTDTSNPITLNAIAGVALQSGSDGDFGAGVLKATRDAALEAAYVNAYSGLIDENILSKNAFPVNIILDADFPETVKAKIAALAVARDDSVAILDTGTTFASKSELVDSLDSYEIFATNRLQTVEGYYGRAKDPYSKKIYKVSATYALASMLPLHFQLYGGKHVPLAGAYGAITKFLPNSVFPVFDAAIDSVLMTKLVELRCNYAEIDARQNIIRGTQTTRQEAITDLSEESCVHIVYDIKRDVEGLMARYRYNFNDPNDITNLNKDIKLYILDKYAKAQVKSITGKLGTTRQEIEMNIIHLTIDLENKKLIKSSVVEINVNGNSNN